MEKLILPEIAAAGVYRSRLFYKNDGMTPPRKVVYFEIELPLESIGCSFFGEKKTKIRADTVICAKPGQVRHSQLPYSCRYVHLALLDGALYHILQNLPNYIRISDISSICRKFDSISALYRSEKEEDLLLVHSTILELVTSLNQEAGRSGSRTNPHGNEVIEKILDYIHADLTKDLRLRTVASFASFSPTYLHTLFFKHMGITLHDYVETLRLQRSMELLANSSHTLTEIAMACGFGSQSHYSYCFKKRLGITPREYVKKLCADYPLAGEFEQK